TADGVRALEHARRARLLLVFMSATAAGARLSRLARPPRRTGTSTASTLNTGGACPQPLPYHSATLARVCRSDRPYLGESRPASAGPFLVCAAVLFAACSSR